MKRKGILLKIGYACLTLGVPDTSQKSLIQKNATEEKLKEIVSHNLRALENILDYNRKMDIRMFRISSDLIPFGSSPVNQLEWWKIFEDTFRRLGDKIIKERMRVSMHPGQYTVLNSPYEDVVRRAVEDLRYHARVLDAMGLDSTHKIILHIGGVYGNKPEAVERFKANYFLLEESIKNRLAIENDDKSYSVEEVLAIGLETGAPVIFDNLHHRVKPSSSGRSEMEWLEACKKTWKPQDGQQKIHYSQQDTNKRGGSHSPTIRIQEFMEFYSRLGRSDLDIMLEVKDKNLSAVKCIQTTKKSRDVQGLESEWSRYKYNVLERSPAVYQQIRTLLKDKKDPDPLEFYQLIEVSLSQKEEKGNITNGLQHVWGYFKNTATESEKTKFFTLLNQFQEGKVALRGVKKFLWQLTVKYDQKYLLNSYYFEDFDLYVNHMEEKG